MHKINRLITNICSERLDESKKFYTKLLQFEVTFDSDWYIQLKAKDGTMELALIDRFNDLIPIEFQLVPKGFYLTFVVENADDVHRIAQQEGFDILSAPADTSYGQRRFLLQDPNGVLLDISSPIRNFSMG